MPQERGMSGGFRENRAADNRLLCESCKNEVITPSYHVQDPNRAECVSCGKPMDHKVYFTVCPHCGFNYRIEISPVKHSNGLSRREEIMSYMVSILVPLSGFVIGAIYINEPDLPSRRVARGCVALGAMNLILTSMLTVILTRWA